jgi:hypothetical protein
MASGDVANGTDATPGEPGMPTAQAANGPGERDGGPGARGVDWPPGAGAGSGPPGRTVTRLTDARALRAYAHPVRMKLMGLLRTQGPLTATRAAELLGESSGTCSFHLRQLAKYGLVEEAGGGTGREKPWRATTTSTDWDVIAENPEMAAAARLLAAVAAEGYFEQLMRWLEASVDEPPEWQDAAWFGDRILYVTAEELAELGRKVLELVDVYFERQVKPELRPPGSRLVSYAHLAFPNDFTAGKPGQGRGAAT